MKIVLNIDTELSIELINEWHAKGIFELVDKNRKYLREWLGFVDYMNDIEFAENFVKNTITKNKDNLEYAFVIIENKKIIGRVGVYKIDNQNKIGEIGYWLAENKQGKGIIKKSCEALINYCFNVLNLNRIEIKCGEQNLKSQSIPKKLNFKYEGKLHQAEWLHNQFIGLNIYALLKENYNV